MDYLVIHNRIIECEKARILFGFKKQLQLVNG